MTDIKDKLQLLVALQEKDCALDVLRNKTKDFPSQIEGQKTSLAQARTDFEATKGKLTQFQMQRKAKELELSSKEEQIKKHNLELNSIKSNDAYKALLGEIADAKTAKSALESEILELMDAVEKESVKIKEDEKKLKQNETDIQANIGRIENELKQVEDQIVAMEKERNDFAATLPKDILNRYDYIRESRGGVAIVPIEGVDCGGCHMVLRPQIINDVCKHQDLISCDSCSRILYKK